MALLKNVSKIWHIDINLPHKVTGEGERKKVIRGERIKIYTHNDPVEVPDEALELPFVKKHIDAGRLIEVATPKKKTEKEVDEELLELRAEAKELGINPGNMGKEKLKARIEEKLDEE